MSVITITDTVTLEELLASVVFEEETEKAPSLPIKPMEPLDPLDPTKAYDTFPMEESVVEEETREEETEEVEEIKDLEEEEAAFWERILAEAKEAEEEKVSNVEPKDIYQDYKEALITLCFYLGKVANLRKLQQDNISISAAYVLHVAENLDIARKDFLTQKEALSLPGGLDFLQNNKFDGFEIKDHFFIGSRETVNTITDPWIDNFNPNNCYLYEVAVYIQYLCFLEESYCDAMLAQPETNKDMVETLKTTETTENCQNWFGKVKGGINKWRTILSSKLSALVPAVPVDTF